MLLIAPLTIVPGLGGELDLDCPLHRDGCWSSRSDASPIANQAGSPSALLPPAGPCSLPSRSVPRTRSLLLVFAIAWRSVDRAVPLAISVAVGALAKLQPGLLLLWMAMTGRWRVLVISVVVIGSFVLSWGGVGPRNVGRASSAQFGRSSGTALFVSNNIATLKVALQLGVAPDVAQALGLLHTVFALAPRRRGKPLVDRRRIPPRRRPLPARSYRPSCGTTTRWSCSFPLAWLLARRQWVGPDHRPWPRTQCSFLVIPPLMYVAAMDIVMVALVWVGRTRRAQSTPTRVSLGGSPVTTRPQPG